MTRILPILTFATLLVACGNATTEDRTVVATDTETVAQTVVDGETTMRLSVSDGYVMAPLKGRDVAAGYFVLSNSGPDAALVSAASSAAATVELHTHTMDDGVMRMREVERIDLPSGETVAFEPGGLHLMMFGFSREEGETEAPVTLTLASGETLDVTLPIRERE